MEVNHEKGNTVRAELEQTKARMMEQRELFRQRGRMLREQRLQGAEKIAEKKEDCRQEASNVASNIRAQREELRMRREQYNQRWKTHGRDLAQRQDKLQEKIRADTKERELERKLEADVLDAELDKLNKLVDDQILRENRARVARVRAETGTLPRLSKQAFINDRWDRADRTREELLKARERRRMNEEQYLRTAFATKEEVNRHQDAAAKKKRDDLKKLAAQIRIEEKEQEELVAATKKAVLDDKRMVHEIVEVNKLVPEDEIMMDQVGLGNESTAAEAMGASFARFFGFRRRGGQNQSSASVSL